MQHKTLRNQSSHTTTNPIQLNWAKSNPSHQPSNEKTNQSIRKSINQVIRCVYIQTKPLYHFSLILPKCFQRPLPERNIL